MAETTTNAAPRTPRPGGHIMRDPRGLKLGDQGRQLSRIKDRCEELGISLTEAAHRCDMAQPQLSKIANGHVAPTLYTALRIAEALDTTVDYLWNMSRNYSTRRAA